MKISDIILDTLEMFVNDHPELEEKDTEMVFFGERKVFGVSRSTSTEVWVNGERFEIQIIPK